MGRFFWFGLLFGSLLLAEPSVYGSHKPHTTRKKPNRSTQLMKRNINSLKRQVSQLKEQVEGLKSIVISLQKRVSRLSRESKRQGGGVDSGLVDDLAIKLNRLEREIKALKKEKRVASVSKPTQKIESKPKSKVVEKEEKRPKEKKKSKIKLTKKEPKKVEKRKETKKPKSEPKTSSAELYKKAKANFSKKLYSTAKEDFEKLVKQGYKSASSYYYLGEIAYNRGKYSDAIEYYQKSAEKKADAPYMDKLLLHTAIALKKNGQKEQAREFFKTVIEAYPVSTSASTAKRYLKSLK